MNGPKESYLTVGKPYGPEEIMQKGSRFISYLYPVKSTEEAEALIAALRKQYRDASHVCPAFRLENGRGEEGYFRFSDDGEPGGTAGMPIYNEIKGKDYLDVLVAVVRYFGGTKLGTGGLVRAYAASARKVLELSEAVTVHIKKEIAFDFPFDLTGEIMQVIQRYDLEILDRQYGAAGVSITLAIPVAREVAVAKAVSDITGGRIKW
jgi:uncharacterized YigZ family protein